MKAITTVKNPLTIIAIFAGLAEVSGTGILPLLEPGIQGLYVWFLMIFPGLLICLFFLTLNFNHKVLYAPSDFQDESHFVDLLQPIGALKKDKQIKNEMDKTIIQKPGAKAPIAGKSLGLKKEKAGSPSSAKINTFRSNYLLAEQLALSSIESEFDLTFRQNVQFKTDNKTFSFGGFAKLGDLFTIVQVKYLPSIANHRRRVREIVSAAEELAEEFQKGPLNRSKINLIIALVTDNFEEEEELRGIYQEDISKRFPSLLISYRFFNLSDDNEEAKK